MLNIDRTAEKAFRIGAWHEIAESFLTEGGGGMEVYDREITMS